MFEWGAFFENEVAAEVFLADIGVVGEVFGGTALKDRALVEEVGTVGDVEGFANVVVGDEDADVTLLEFEDDVLDVLNSDGVDAGEWFVEEKESRVVSQRTCYLGTATLATRKLDAFAFADVAQVELFDEGVEFLFALLFVEVFAELEDGHDVVLDGHVAENGGLLCEIAHTHLRALVHGELGEFDGLAAFAAIGFRGEINFPTIRLDDAHHHIESGGLSCTIGAEEAHYFALSDFDRGTFDDGAGAVFFDNVVGVEDHFFIFFEVGSARSARSARQMYFSVRDTCIIYYSVTI